MASVFAWGDIVGVLLLLIAVMSFIIPETSSASYPLQHKGLLPAGKKVGESLHPSITKEKVKRKKAINKLSKSSSAKVTGSSHLVSIQSGRGNKEELPMPTYKSQLYGNAIRTNSKHPSENGERRKPFYDCPLFHNGNDEDKAIIKPDPYDCGCCYYCNWGVHYVQCCSWPLLWNDSIKSCDWYWKVSCQTYDGWNDDVST